MKAEQWSWAEMNAAIPAYLGYHRHPEPIVDWDAVVVAIGAGQANALELHLLRILSLVRLQKPDSRLRHPDRVAERAVHDALLPFPMLDERSRKALFWLRRHECT